ncbi:MULTISPECIES: hypothetical protein [Bacillaceae]|uniref:hypothetical protein n=1 Tax=Bacillaceae TaxID=186817 RepID=UPI00203E103C|nr:hypothetical protein [Caldibacillus thermoamylovorans]MCM3056403.1 hypothetical protein [Caldibacillus thermoamylovorans]
MATRANLVTVLSQETSIFDDESCSRYHFWLRNAQFRRRVLFSSPFSVKKRPILAMTHIQNDTF